jgi:hypothetical protein
MGAGGLRQEREMNRELGYFSFAKAGEQLPLEAAGIVACH